MKQNGTARGMRMVLAWPKRQHGVRILAAFTLTSIFLWLLSQRLVALDIEAVKAAFAAVSAVRWVLAIAATAISFWAVGQYDGCLHRHLNTQASARIAAKITARAGIAAIALGQTLGLGVLTGALVRWRMLPAMSLLQATKLSAAVALSFLLGWSLVTALVLSALPDAPFKPAAFVICGLGAVMMILCLLQPRLRILGRAVALPNIFTFWHIVAFTFVDTLAAATALWLLCPPDLALPFAALLPAYLLALGAGLLSGTPGGVGAFEITFLAALPTVPEAGLIAGVLAFRMCYYALPALIGAGLAMAAPNVLDATPNPLIFPHPLAPAEAGLTAQNQIRLFSFPNNTQGLIGETPHCVTLLLDPFGAAPAATILRSLKTQATSRARVPCLYKCGARLAATARAAGWHVAPVAAEAWLTPSQFTLDGPDKSALRRKLRKAQKAGVTLRALVPADFFALASIATEWAQDNGGERGFSMGRFAPSHLHAQRLFGAFLHGALIGFISFHQNRHAWALDLMRHRHDLPDGTMYALVAQAIATAKNENLPCLSLAAAPRLPDFGPVLRRFAPPAGLCQFKAAFAPRWQPLYIAAPNRAALALAAVEIYRAIHAPPPLMCDPARGGEDAKTIATHGLPWQREGK